MTSKKSDPAKNDLDQRIELFVKAVAGKKAADICVLDLRGLSSVADIFIICSAFSSRQSAAIGDYIERYLKNHGIKALSVEGKNEGLWALLDYGEIVIHVFHEPVRKFYNLEGLWSDAKRIVTDNMVKMEKNTGETEIYVE
jgi:ribosome-associated protein